MYKDLRQVREHDSALRDLIAQHAGGRDDVVTQAQVTVLCEAAIAALEERFGLEAQVSEGAVTFFVPSGEEFVPRLFAELGERPMLIVRSREVVS